MISVEQALAIVKQHTIPYPISETISLDKALGRLLFEDLMSPISMPPFRQSAMDGYALNKHDLNSYTLIGEIKAGDDFRPQLKKGEAVRIFTGAPVPDTANAVMMQEKVEAINGIAKLQTEVKLEENIRPLGEQIKKGDVASQKGAILSPAAIGFLTSLGITSVVVQKQPKIAIVVTGNELAQAGTDLKFGQIYESNALMLRSALKDQGQYEINISKVADNYQDTFNLLKDIITNNDLVLVSGGISVGDYDFVGSALLNLGIEQLFYKVKQKPGKPLFFGKNQNTLVFALPGNPAAALSCFYIYVNTAIQRLSGHHDFEPKIMKAISKSNFTKKGDRAQFLKAIYNNGEVSILEGQNSSMLHTFALANALVYVPETIHGITSGDEVEVIPLSKSN